MNLYLVLIHDWEENEHYSLGIYSSRELAGQAMGSYMAAEYGQSEYHDWDLDDLTGNWQYFYDGFTVEIQRSILDEDNTGW